MKNINGFIFMPQFFAEKLTLTAAFSLPVGLRGILFELATLEFVSPTVFNYKGVMANGIMLFPANIFFHMNL